MKDKSSKFVNVANVEKKVDEVLSSRKHSNNITEIYNAMQNDDSGQVICMRGLERMFVSFFERKEFHIDPNLKLLKKKEWEMEAEYIKWLKESYEKILLLLYKIMDSGKEDIEKPAMTTLMKLISSEGDSLLQNDKENKAVKTCFPIHRLEEVVKILISSKSRKSNLIICFEEYVKYKDVYFYTWKTLKNCLSQLGETNDILMLNVLELMEKISLTNPLCKKNSGSAAFGDEILCHGESSKGLNYKINGTHIQKLIKKVWLNLINRNVSLIVHRKMMVTLLEAFLPNMDKPIYFTDFLVASSNLGGANSLLAMQGILTLVQKHNIEYPNIYQKLYNMFEPNILHTKYKSRLFYLADIFLSSTHLPECLVASFAKRVARLCLSAQVPDIIVSIHFIKNLLLRHPGLKKMIHHPEAGQVPEDPFLATEGDPMQTRASESCLWEISLLKSHVQPGVSSISNFIDKNLPQMECDLREFLDVTYKDLFQSESKKRTKACLSISRPQKISKLQDDRIYKMWTLT